jgi:hypothetical protein
LEKNYHLPQKYLDFGFALCKVGEKSFALRCHGELVFFFVSGIDGKEDFISQLCDWFLKHGAKGNSMTGD